MRHGRLWCMTPDDGGPEKMVHEDIESEYRMMNTAVRKAKNAGLGTRSHAHVRRRFQDEGVDASLALRFDEQRREGEINEAKFEAEYTKLKKEGDTPDMFLDYEDRAVKPTDADFVEGDYVLYGWKNRWHVGQVVEVRDANAGEQPLKSVDIRTDTKDGVVVGVSRPREATRVVTFVPLDTLRLQPVGDSTPIDMSGASA